ncbi:Conserved exported protein of uncharacterised function [Mycobacteroides abscessus subsp. abscessus]|nr:Conserved exported protein of uncharacterised function [Mycobacteroides abscessus subsp. abscessus]
MAGKPLLAGEVEALREQGLSIVSCYQFGKGPTADWRGGLEAGKKHAERGLELHLAAGGPDGVYANAPTIELARVAGLGAWYWQHNWGTPKGFVHPGAHLHQFEIDKRTVDGIGVDVNDILKPQYGQWS